MLQPHLDRRPLSRVHHLAIAATLFALTFVIAEPQPPHKTSLHWLAHASTRRIVCCPMCVSF